MELALLVLAALVASAAAAGQELPAALRRECPARCVCSTWLSLPAAFCTSQGLFSVYAGVPSIVQALDLSNNTVSHLEDRQLSRAGLTKLKYLNLSMNAINEIGLNAFQDLTNLTVLDLSMNHLDYVASDTFYYNPKLRILRLAGNKFNLHVPELHSSSITELDLSGCRINHLVKNVFAGMKQLRKLDLSNNVLFDLDKDVLRPVPYLRTIMLARNKFICDGSSIESLKLHLRNRNVHTDAFCEKSSMPTREKFERIIALKTLAPSDDPNKLPPRTIRLPPTSSKDPWARDSWREFEEVVREQEHENGDAESSGIFASAWNNVSPFWFLLIGFLLGSGATMVVTYLWLSTTISCLIPRIRRAETVESTDANSQRVSLLRHLWQQEHLANAEDSTVGSSGGGTGAGGNAGATVLSAPSCPGTPPPPYREVMLHRNLYPRAAMAAAAAAARGGDASPASYNV